MNIKNFVKTVKSNKNLAKKLAKYYGLDESLRSSQATYFLTPSQLLEGEETRKALLGHFESKYGLNECQVDEAIDLLLR